MASRTAYADDFYLWSQEQAELLRSLPRSNRDLPNALDIDAIAEEIADVGKSELSTVQSCLSLILTHLIKLAAHGIDAQPARGWASESLAFHRKATRSFSPGMRQLIAMDHLWQQALSDIEQEFALYNEAIPALPQLCPFELDDLLAERLDLRAMLMRLSVASGS